ncbi:hypothetical protein [Mycolicibacterium sp.]|uniref:hypothetical protein n=1 Tax=Mycolicibacterium sp. TaxID=2320850 RepID=UPI0025F8D215|nr:hypothetical protein [Mycolicibacterium sp.]
MLNYLALLGWGYRRGPRRLQSRGDGEGLRRHRRQLQPGPLRPEEGRSHQRRAHPQADPGRVRGPAACLLRRARSRHRARRERVRDAAADLVQTRVVVLSDAWELLKFLDDDAYAIDPKAGSRELTGDAAAVLDSALGALDGLGEWTAASIEAALKGALIDGLGLKPRKAFGPIRVAATGATVSPPLFESLELLGRERSLRRLREARDGAAPKSLVVCSGVARRPGIVGSDQLLWVSDGVWCNWQHS